MHVKRDVDSILRFDSDRELVRRAQQGDADAFACLFHAHKARIYSVCLRMTNNTAEAEDLTQDAFMQVFRKLSTFRGDSALSTWLYRIAVNTVLMHFRKKALHQISLDEPCSQDAKLVRREYGSTDDRLNGSVDRIALARAIRELPDGYRTIFLLHEVEGYEHQEIAELLDCSVGNSKSQLHKAKLRIRELLRHARPALEQKKRREVGGFRLSAPRARQASQGSNAADHWDAEAIGQHQPPVVPQFSSFAANPF
jgi:RNA polymerase sigma-70 factor, ECF subfamily